MPKNTLEGLKKEFEESKGIIGHTHNSGPYTRGMVEAMEYFISKIEARDKELLEKIEGMKRTVAELFPQTNKMLSSTQIHPDVWAYIMAKNSYNKALSDIKDLITNQNI